MKMSKKRAALDNASLSQEICIHLYSYICRGGSMISLRSYLKTYQRYAGYLFRLLGYLLGLRVESQLGRLLDWERGEKPGPWYVTLFPTNRCNLTCKICWLRGVDVESVLQNELSDERMLELVDECADLGVKHWVIIGGGEPLMRGSSLISLCQRISDRNMTGILQTNGTLLKKKYAERLVDMQWQQINRVQIFWNKADEGLRTIMQPRHTRNCAYVPEPGGTYNRHPDPRWIVVSGF